MLLRDVLATVSKNVEIMIKWYWYDQLEDVQIIRPYMHRDEIDALDCEVISIGTNYIETKLFKKSMLVINIDTTKKHLSNK